MKSNKHVVWITPGFAKSELDTTTIPSMQKLALQFQKSNPEITLEVLAIHFSFQTQTYLWNNITVHCLGGKNARYPGRFLLWRRVLKKLSEIHLENRIDIVHSFWYSESALLASLFCKKRSIHHICSIMGQDAQRNNKYFWWLKRYPIIKVAISNRNAHDFLIASGLKADAIIPIGIDPFVVDDKGPRHIDIIGVGTLSKVKRLDIFLRVVERVKLVRSNLKVLIVGDGPDRESIQEYVRRLGLEDTVRFTGLVPRTEALGFMAQSKILLHTSEWEGMGYIFLEAAACGCLIAATPIGIVEQDQFTFVSPNEEILAEQIIQWLETETEYESRYPYLLEHTTREYVNLYNNKR